MLKLKTSKKLGVKLFQFYKLWIMNECNLHLLYELCADDQYGWQIRTPTKSFTVYAASLNEKREWINHINMCIKDLLDKSKSILFLWECKSISYYKYLFLLQLEVNPFRSMRPYGYQTMLRINACIARRHSLPLSIGRFVFFCFTFENN